MILPVPSAAVALHESKPGSRELDLLVNGEV